jgi:hypothetical protein
MRRRILRLHPNVFFLGVVSLLTDVSSEMIFTLVPLFLVNVLGSATTIVGVVGGISESADAILRIGSGWLQAFHVSGSQLGGCSGGTPR